MPIPMPRVSMEMYEEIRWNEFVERATWRLKFCWLPKKCAFSGRSIWMKIAYQGLAIWTGPGEAIEEIRWAEPGEYLMARLRGDIK